MLTNAAVKAAHARACAYKIGDAGGLYLFVRPNGRRTFRMKYRFARAEKLLTFGDFPALSLADARARRDEARAQIDGGTDPAAVAAHARAAERTGTIPILPAAATFEDVARRWHARREARWSTVHARDVLASLERDAFPTIGGLAPAAIHPITVMDLVIAIEARGCIETARRVHHRISAVFRFAKSIDEASANPAAQIKEELSPRAVQRSHPALLDAGDARALLDAVDRVDGSPIAKLASRFLALTGLRLAGVRGARWDEFEGLELGHVAGVGNMAAPLWRVPAARMKLFKVRKADPGAAHLVPLSAQAVAVLRAARALGDCGGGAGSALVFPGRGGRRPIGESAIGDLYIRAGYAGRHVPHGWRASFSTIMNKRRPGDSRLIEAALAHSAKDKVEAAYNRATDLDLRRELFQQWADLLIG